MITLRTPQQQDLESLYLWENDPSVWEYGTENGPYSRTEIEQFISRGDTLLRDNQQRLMVDLHNQPIGCVDLYHYNHLTKSAYVGILIYNHRQQGYGAKALSALAQYASNNLQISELRATVPMSNAISRALFTKAGYKELTGNDFSLRL